jgi:hypothetical protein
MSTWFSSYGHVESVVLDVEIVVWISAKFINFNTLQVLLNSSK